MKLMGIRSNPYFEAKFQQKSAFWAYFALRAGDDFYLEPLVLHYIKFMKLYQGLEEEKDL